MWHWHVMMHRCLSLYSTKVGGSQLLKSRKPTLWNKKHVKDQSSGAAFAPGTYKHKSHTLICDLTNELTAHMLTCMFVCFSTTTRSAVHSNHP